MSSKKSDNGKDKAEKVYRDHVRAVPKPVSAAVMTPAAAAAKRPGLRRRVEEILASAEMFRYMNQEVDSLAQQIEAQLDSGADLGSGASRSLQFDLEYAVSIVNANMCLELASQYGSDERVSVCANNVREALEEEEQDFGAMDDAAKELEREIQRAQQVSSSSARCPKP